MSFKIFSKNNYLFIIDTDTDNYILDGKIKDVYFKRLNEPIERYFVVNPIGLTKYILRSEIVKENGSPYLSNEWEDFYTSLTETQSVTAVIDDSTPINVNDEDLTNGNQQAQILANVKDVFAPNQDATTGTAVVELDPLNQVIARATVLTDEISIRDDFSSTLGSDYISEITGNGTINVSGSKLLLTSGTAIGKTSVKLAVDYCPITFRGVLDISQRVANQTIILGFTDGAFIEFSNTDAQKVNCISKSNYTDAQSTNSITLPATITTASQLFYKIDVSNNAVTFQVSSNGLNYTPLVQHVLHIPNPYDALDFEISIENTDIASDTTIGLDMLFINNMDRIQIDQDFTGEPLPAQLIGAVGNTYKNIGATPSGQLQVELSGNNVSSFGDINTAELEPLIQADFVYGILSHYGAGAIVGTGVVDTSSARLRLQTGAGTTGSATYQSAKVAKYRAGQGIDARFTAVFSDGANNSFEEFGAGDLVNGYFFSQINGVFGILHRNNSIDTFIPQNQWNVDPCDGTGLSALNLDKTKGNAYKVKYPYQGYANVKFFVYDSNVGQYILVHQIEYANSFTAVQVTNPNMTFWARSVNTGNNTNLTSYVGSFAFFLSGKRKYLGLSGYAYNNKAITTGGGLTNVFSIRNATTFNGVANKSLIRLTSIVLSVGNLGNNQFGYLFLIKNATIGGTPVFVADSGTTSNNGVTITNGQTPVSVDTAGTTITGGSRVWGANGVNTSNALLDITETDIFIAPGETLSFVALVTGNASISAVCNYINDI